jgi:hypothetical protein
MMPPVTNAPQSCHLPQAHCTIIGFIEGSTSSSTAAALQDLVGKGVHRRFGMNSVMTITRCRRSSSSRCRRYSAHCSARCFLAICTNPARCAMAV